MPWLDLSPSESVLERPWFFFLLNGFARYLGAGVSVCVYCVYIYVHVGVFECVETELVY